MIKNKELKRRIIELSYKHRLSHIGSCITAIDVINAIYSSKRKGDKFVLSSGHAHLAHLVVREEHFEIDNLEELLEKGGIHCDRKVGCDVSSGSLGHGLGISIGMALSDRTRDCYCLISDGECMEGSIWEALRIACEQHLDNLKIFVNCNGYGAYRKIDMDILTKDLNTWRERGVNIEVCDTRDVMKPFEVVEGLKGQSAHYYTLKDEDYENLIEQL